MSTASAGWVERRSADRKFRMSERGTAAGRLISSSCVREMSASRSARPSSHPLIDRRKGFDCERQLAPRCGVTTVFAVDSGTNQLAWKLRQDPRVIVHEQTSARILTDAQITESVDLIVCDASFIGLAKVLERPMTFAKPDARLMALVKPQFEAGRGEVSKGGVVRDVAVRARVCDDCSWLKQSLSPMPRTTEISLKQTSEGSTERLLQPFKRWPGDATAPVD